MIVAAAGIDEEGWERLSACVLCGETKLNPLDPACRIASCASCGYVFDNPRPTARELARFYSAPGKYDPWLAEERGRDRMWLRRLAKLERTKKPGTLLDVGAGIGQFLHHARHCYAEVSGTEISDSAIATAKERYGLELLKGDLGEIDFGGRTFDNISLFHVLEHVPDPGRVVERCRELLSPAGILIVAVPNEMESFKETLKVLLKRAGSRRFANVGRLGLAKIVLDGSVREIHLSHFTPPVLRRLLETRGFSVIDCSLDPYYSATGIWNVFYWGFYQVCRAILGIWKRNVYDTIHVVARKTEGAHRPGDLFQERAEHGKN